MRISLNWLKDYLDFKPELDINQISESLTLAGLEVEAIERVRPKSERLSLGVVVKVRESSEDSFGYDVDVAGELLTVVGPKSSIRPGMVVAFKRFDDPNKKSEFKGSIANYGNLGFPLGTNEVIAFDRDVFGPDLPANLAEVKDFDDVIFTLGITPNRADALSHLGVSRELCALLDLGSRSPMLTPKEMAGPTHEKVAIEIDNADDCPRYACRVVENICVRESPFWIKMRLLAAGIRPINNVVDVTNYVMLSRGQPMHAFDYDKLHMDNGRAKIIIKRATLGEKFTALDGQELTLSSEDVVVSDLEKNLALAGVIGGIDSGISSETTTVLLESAYFEPKNVRMTARRLGISTESSYRFERGCDPNGVVDALNYAARLLTDITDARVCREPIDAYRKRMEPQEIRMRPERAQGVLGIDAANFDQDLLRRRFLRLGIETVAKRGDAIYFRVPTHRSDLTREIDLIEEAARMIGYEKVNETHVGLGAEIDQFADPKSEMVIKKLRQSLAARGFSEAINYAFLNKEFQSRFIDSKDEANIIEVKNPLSERYGVMRLSLIPGLIKNLLHNQRNQEKSIQLFELGTIFVGKREAGAKPSPDSLDGSLDQDSFCIEKQMISGVMAGLSAYHAFDHVLKALDFYHLKGVLSEAFHAVSLNDQFPNANIFFEHGSDRVYLHPGESSTIVYRPSVSEPRLIVGHFGKLHPEVASALGVLGDAYLFELDLKEIANIVSRIPKFKPFSRYPTIERDVAFLVDEEVKVGDILRMAEAVHDAKLALLNLRVFDIYRGKNIEPGKKSVAISLALQREDRTLTDEEAEAFVGEYIKLVEQETGAKVR